MLRRLLLPITMLPLAFALSATAQSGDAVDVVVVSGRLDSRGLDFVHDAIADTTADVVVLQMDVPAVLEGDLERLLVLVADPPVPVAVWVGPDPAVAHGGAVQILAEAQVRGAAPGVTIGWASPVFAGGAEADALGDLPHPVVEGRIQVTGPVPGLVEVVEPSIGQFVVGLDGRSFTIDGQKIVLETAEVEDVDGVATVKPTASVRFVEEGVIDRLLHLTTRPEAAFLFLLIGITFAAFEFYAAGPGLAAAVASVTLLLAGYGIAVLPVWWPGIAATLLGLWLYLVEFQHNDLGWRSLLGTGLLVFGGLRFVDASPQIVPVWWMVVLAVAATALFFGFALTTVVRARFSTQTIGRDHLIGRPGIAVGPIAPEGTIEVAGARWRARSTRQSGIDDGDAVVVVRIDGVVLEVDPAP